MSSADIAKALKIGRASVYRVQGPLLASEGWRFTPGR
jgi:hypothetical protein